ncbi:MAG TPA: DUF481 domain-containing protein [bacterium]|nr:DUF481 domain-containing protein [bacterium]
MPSTVLSAVLRPLARIAPGRAGFRPWLAGGLILALPAAGAAQVNIEKQREDDEERGFATTAAVDLSVRTGNTDVTEFTGEIRTDLVRDGASGFLLGRGGLGWKDGDRFSDSALLHLRTGVPLRPSWEMETFGQIDYDKERKLDFRAIAGIGPRFFLEHDESFSLAVGTAYMREHERYDLDEIYRTEPARSHHPRDLDVSRWSNYLSLSTHADRVKTSWIVYAQPRLDRFDDVRILSEASVSVAVSGKVDLRNLLRVRWDSEPPDGIEDTDVELTTGIAVRL